MTHFIKLLSVFCILHACLLAKEFETFYGPIDVEEPVLIELIESSSFQRLKDIHQYGVSYYTTHREEYTRYAHSLGVFVVLRKHGASLKEQIAGLLHDVSHTVFSHVGDWIFPKEYQDEDDYQNSIHADYLQTTVLGEILVKYGYTPTELLPTEELFPALEQKRPNLSADRIDYNIQGAYYQNYITHREALEILNDLSFTHGKWFATNEKLLEKLVRYSLFMNQDCWSSHTNCVSSKWLADAILRALQLGTLSMHDIHFGTDSMVWDQLNHCQDPVIVELMHKIQDAKRYYTLVEPEHADVHIKAKFMGIDPWILKEGQLVRLTALSASLDAEYQAVKKTMNRGWTIKFNNKNPSM